MKSFNSSNLVPKILSFSEKTRKFINRGVLIRAGGLEIFSIKNKPRRLFIRNLRVTFGNILKLAI